MVAKSREHKEGAIEVIFGSNKFVDGVAMPVIRFALYKEEHKIYLFQRNLFLGKIVFLNNNSWLAVGRQPIGLIPFFPGMLAEVVHAGFLRLIRLFGCVNKRIHLWPVRQ
jgi:hypothetical protein